jgi:hypothetical protein
MARQIPALIKAAERGDSKQTIMIVGRKRLPEGRVIEMRLVAEGVKDRQFGTSYTELSSKDWMCGRYVVRDQAAIERHFNLRQHQFKLNDRYNVAPTTTVPVVPTVGCWRGRHNQTSSARTSTPSARHAFSVSAKSR